MKKYLLLTSLLLSAMGHTAQAAPTLSISSSTALPDSDITLQLSITDVDAAYGGFNARLEYPACMSVTSVVAGSLLTDSFVIDSIGTDEGIIKNLSLIAYSGVDTFATDGELLSLTFHVGADCSAGQYVVNFATVDAEPLVNNKHALSNQDGSVSISHQVSNGGIVITDIDNDIDKDGMDDDWERLYFGDLSHNGFADSDKDGYTDLQEYLNFMAGELDASGAAFNPMIANEPGGSGYKEPTKGNFWILMMPVIQGATQQAK
ncbi:MAG: cohesin domain-containing protein [Pseudomonadota bacterium]